MDGVHFAVLANHVKLYRLEQTEIIVRRHRLREKMSSSHKFNPGKKRKKIQSISHIHGANLFLG